MMARGGKFVTPLAERLEPWPPGKELDPSSLQGHAHLDGAFIDFLWGDIESGVWRYRRDPSVIRGMDRIALRTAEGIPFLAPELVLLYKSKNTSGKERSKDQGDFALAHTSLTPEQRAWLRWALLVSDPEHPWIAELV